MVFAQFKEPALRPLADQELVELRDPVAIHAAIAMARAEIALVQREMLVGAFAPVARARRRRHCAAGSGAGCDRAGTAHRNPHGHAGMATVALRPIDDVAGATESPAQRQRIQARQARVARIDHQVARIALGPVAAGMLGGLEQAQLADHLVLLEWIGAHGRSIAPAAQGEVSTKSARPESLRYGSTTRQPAPSGRTS